MQREWREVPVSYPELGWGGLARQRRPAMLPGNHQAGPTNAMNQNDDDSLNLRLANAEVRD